MPTENFRQELNRLASEKGYFLQDCCTCFLLTLKSDKELKPQPCLRLLTLKEVKLFLME